MKTIISSTIKCRANGFYIMFSAWGDKGPPPPLPSAICWLVVANTYKTIPYTAVGYSLLKRTDKNNRDKIKYINKDIMVFSND